MMRWCLLPCLLFFLAACGSDSSAPGLQVFEDSSNGILTGDYELLRVNGEEIGSTTLSILGPSSNEYVSDPFDFDLEAQFFVDEQTGQTHLESPAIILLDVFSNDSAGNTPPAVVVGSPEYFVMSAIETQAMATSTAEGLNVLMESEDGQEQILLEFKKLP
jgi:hypothetical protein